jgi:hypothetical protein
MFPNRLNNAAFPSITGNAASGPMLPNPNTADPSVTTAIEFRFDVNRRASSLFFAIAKHTRATPGVYTIDKSSRFRIGCFDRISIFPPRCIKNVRSETFPITTPGTNRITATNSSACSVSRAPHVTSICNRSCPDAVTSNAVTLPPAASTADVNADTDPPPAGTSNRTVIE